MSTLGKIPSVDERIRQAVKEVQEKTLRRVFIAYWAGMAIGAAIATVMGWHLWHG